MIDTRRQNQPLEATPSDKPFRVTGRPLARRLLTRSRKFSRLSAENRAMIYLLDGWVMPLDDFSCLVEEFHD